jgi:hypothetical protein
MFDIFPRNIDSLSDFTSEFKTISPNSFVDDFHNVFLQTFFSYGILFGVLFFLSMSAIFFKVDKMSDQQLLLLPLYATFYSGLYFGILSANYMFFGYIVIGFLISKSNKNIDKRAVRQKKGRPLILAILFAFPLFISILDFNERQHISKLSRNYIHSSDKERVVKDITNRIQKVDDAGYRFLVIQNLLAIGDCSRADAVIMLMRVTNPREIRLQSINLMKENSVCAER